MAPGVDGGGLASRVNAILAQEGGDIGDNGVFGATIIVAPELHDERVRDWIQPSMDGIAEQTVVLVTRGDAWNLKHLRHFVVGAVVTPSEIEHKLLATVVDVAATPLRYVLARTGNSSRGLDPLVREIVVVACTVATPIGTVSGLSRVLSGCSRGTIYRRWRTAPHCLGSPLGFVQRVNLLRFCEMVEGTGTIEATVRRFPAGRSTLYAASHRHFGVPLGQLAAPPQQLLTRWVQNVVNALTRQPSTASSD